MLRISQAILHVFDFETSQAYVSSECLDLDDKIIRSFVQRHVRKIVAHNESRHGQFNRDSEFLYELRRFAQGGREFVEFSSELAYRLFSELQHSQDLDPADLLVVDFEDMAPEERAMDARELTEAHDPDPRRYMALVLLQRKQAFSHVVGPRSNEILRQDTTLPSPSQKIDSYILIDLEEFTLEFKDKKRQVGSEMMEIIADRFLQCNSTLSSTEIVAALHKEAARVADDFGLNATVVLSRMKAEINHEVEAGEAFEPALVGRAAFRGHEQAEEAFRQSAEQVVADDCVPLKRRSTARAIRQHRIRTDTGIELVFPSDIVDKTGYISFETDAEGMTTITLRNIQKIENRS